MAGHDEDEEYDLGKSQQLTAKAASKHLTRISHVANVRIPPLELADHIARVGGQATQADQDNHRAGGGDVSDRYLTGGRMHLRD